MKEELCFHYEINQESRFLHIPFFFLRKEINIITLALINSDTFLRITQDFYLNYFLRQKEFLSLSDLISSNQHWNLSPEYLNFELPYFKVPCL